MKADQQWLPAISEQAKYLDTLINGVQTDLISVRDRGLHYGDGCFETIRIHHRTALLLEQHIQRLVHGCKVLEIPVDFIALQRELLTILGQQSSQHGVLKILVTRGESGRGYRFDSHVKPTRILMFSPLPEQMEDKSREGVHLGISPFRLSQNQALAGLKHLNRLDQVMASRDLETELDEVLCLDINGNLIEGTKSNLVVVINEQLITPCLLHAGVDGVMLNYLKQRFLADGNNMEQRELPYEDLTQVTEWFLCNSVFGVWPVRKLSENDTVRTWGVGPWTRQAIHYHNEVIHSAS